MRLIEAFYQFECQIFRGLNRHFDKRFLNFIFRTITNIGGAFFTIGFTLFLILVTSNEARLTSLSSALALAVSHLPVQFVKKRFPRQRPYLILEKTKFPSNPLKDHSFPSGHTTAIFSIVTPFILFIPAFTFVLLPLALFVGSSRIYLGLHYPSDVLAGGIIGSVIGYLSFHFLVA
ncbi:phosphatase PAP2 family protein [Bacillota bacterium Lsc_1132]